MQKIAIQFQSRCQRERTEKCIPADRCRGPYYRLLFLVLGALSSPWLAIAQPLASDNYVMVMERGRAELNQAYSSSSTELIHLHANAALSAFREAEKIRPGNPEPVFFEGVALISLGDNCRAVEKIQFAQRAGYDNPLLQYELASALIAIHSFDDGIAADQIYIRNNPNAPNIGTARDLLTLAEQQRAIEQEKAARHALGPNVTDSPPPTPTPPPPRRFPLNIAVISGVGYNDNVISLGNNQSLPPDIPHQDAFYNESGITLGRSWTTPRLDSNGVYLKDKFGFGYALSADTYDDLSASDQILQIGTVAYSHSLSPVLAAAVKLSDFWLLIDGAEFSNTIAAQPALVYTPNDRWSAQLSYVCKRNDYFTPTTTITDSDGFTHRLDLLGSYNFCINPKSGIPKLTLGGDYGHEWTYTDGLAGDRQRDELLTTLQWSVTHASCPSDFLRDVTLSASYTYRLDEYSNVIAPATSARQEHFHIPQVALSVKMWYDQLVANEGISTDNRLEAILQYQFTSRESNIVANNYRQNYVLLSMKVNF